MANKHNNLAARRNGSGLVLPGGMSLPFPTQPKPTLVNPVVGQGEDGVPIVVLTMIGGPMDQKAAVGHADKIQAVLVVPQKSPVIVEGEEQPPETYELVKLVFEHPHIIEVFLFYRHSSVLPGQALAIALHGYNDLEPTPEPALPELPSLPFLDDTSLNEKAEE